MSKGSYQKIIANILGTKPIAYNPDLARLLGSAKAGILISQLLYWWEKGKNKNWIYKTIKEMEKETALSRSEQDTAIRKCKEIGILEVKVKSIPATRHFKINIDKLTELLKSRLQESYKQDCDKLPNSVAKKQQSITDNTTKNNSEENYSNKEKIKMYKKGKKFGEKPYYRGDEMRWFKEKWWVIPKDGGDWLEFAGKEEDIKWK